MSGVWAVVLAHGGRELTLDCLASLDRSAEPCAVVLVDNASSDGTAAAVRARFPEAVVLEQATNLGYAGGNNAGIAHALAHGAEHVLVLNNDTLVERAAVGRLRAALLARPGAAAAAPLLTFAEPADRIWSAGARYDPRRGLRPGRMEQYREPIAAVGPARVIDRFTGAAVMFPRAVLERERGFDDGLFFLYEDVELSLRLRAGGATLWFEPAAVVRHRVAMTQGGEHSPSSFYYGVRNQLIVADRFAPGGTARRTLRLLAATAGHLARVRHAGQRRAAITATLQGARDYRVGIRGPRPVR